MEIIILIKINQDPERQTLYVFSHMQNLNLATYFVCVYKILSMSWELRGAVKGGSRDWEGQWENKYAQRTTIQMKCHKTFCILTEKVN